jgi:CheY-specific phosphatase CheX
MITIDAQTLSYATITALERTAMVFAEPAGNGHEQLEPVTRFARIGFTGPGSGTLVLGATERFLRCLAAGLLGVEPEEVSVEDHGLDALKEMANIVGGSVVLAMSGDTGEYSLGLPEVVSVADMSVPSATDTTASVDCTIVADDGVLRAIWTVNAAGHAA